MMKSTTLTLALSLATTAAARSAEIHLAPHTFTVPDGFVVERVTTTDLVERPITMALDEKGRLYVTDSSGDNSRGPEQLKRRSHRIRRLQDSNGDGVYDRSTLFADRMMLPEGSMWLDGSLYVAAPPSIWKLTDTNDDGVADLREEWFEGHTLTGCANDLHGPYRGLDGWIYWCKGAFAEQRHERPGREPFVSRAAHIFRRRPEGGPVEHVMTGGMDNPVDVAFLPNGERFFTTTFLQHPGDGRRDGIIHAIYGGVYGKRHGVLDGHPRTGDLMPVMTHLGAAAPCGLTTYSSRVFGRDFENNLFATLFNLHKVTRHALRPIGGTYTSVDSDFLVSDQLDFHPTDVLEDADGSLLVCDTGGWYKICCPTSQLAKTDVLGAIYRVRRRDAPAIEDPRGEAVAWQTADIDDLVELLGDRRPVARARAIDELSSRGAKALEALREATSSRKTHVATNAIWTLTRMQHEGARDVVRSSINSQDAQVAHAALHSVSVWQDRAVLDDLTRLVSDRSTPSSRLRVAAEALGRIARAADREATRSLLEAAARPLDRATEHSVIFALIEIGDAQGIQRLGRTTSDPRSRRAILMAAAALPGASFDVSQLPAVLQEADCELFEGTLPFAARSPNLSAALVDAAVGHILGDDDPARHARQIVATVSTPFGQSLISSLLDRERPNVARERALTILESSPVENPPTAWVDSLLSMTDDALTRERCLRILGSWKLPPEAGAKVRARWLAVLGDDSAPVRTRLLVLRAILTDHSPETRSHWPFVISQLHRDRPLDLRDLAASIVERSSIDPSMREQLLGTLPSTSPLEIGRLFGALTRASQKDPEAARRLSDALASCESAAAISEEALQSWLKTIPPGARASAAKALARITPDREEQRRSLLTLASRLPKGDVRRGQQIFHDEKASCFACHAMGYLGGTVGPDLTRIGKIRSELDLLEAVAYPSASFVRSYEPMTVVTTTGRIVHGIIRSRSESTLDLVTGARTLERLSTSDIAEVRPSQTSVMPAGLTEQLTHQQIADLIAFLRASK